MLPSTHDSLIQTSPPPPEQPTLRTLVHKRLADNVLLTEIGACGTDRFECAGRVPPSHLFFTNGGRRPRADILFYTELGRQASLAISHAFLDVNLDDIFIFEQSEAELTGAALRRHSSADSDAVAIEIALRETVRRRNNAVSRVVADYVMTIGGERVFQGTGAWTMQAAALFNRLRRGTPRRQPDAASLSAASPFDPGRSGANIVISPPEYLAARSAFVSSLIVDRTHPYFFDHPCDHVPGMLLLEGCAQLAMAACAVAGHAPGRAAVASYAVNFQQFIECDVPAALTARVEVERAADRSGAPVTVHTAISQGDVVAGTARMSVAFAL
jgi:hypothetical protein